MTKVKLPVAADARVYNGNPDQNFGGLTKLTVCALPASRQSLLHFNQPFPLGVQILSATLRVYQKGAAAGGARTVTANRILARWDERTVTYNNRPSGGGAAPTRTLGNSATNGREWAFDVKADMQAVSDGTPWYGFRLTSDNATLLDFYAREGGGTFTPTLEVEWSDAPFEPSQLSPSAGRSVSTARPTLRCDYFDPDGSLEAVQFQVSTSASFTSPAFDSGELPADLPEWKLTSDLTNGATYYWRARVRNLAGVWSPWSDTAVFRRATKATVTITNPPAATPTVYESMPTFSWTVAGGTQQAYQLFIVDPADPTEVLWDSRKLTSVAASVQLPASQRLLLSPGNSYRLVLRVWDSVNRESIPEESVYTEVSRDFDFGTSGAISGVTDLTISTDAESPFATLEFKRATVPDAFLVVEGGKTIAVLDPEDYLVSGTTYRYVDRRSAPRSTHTWGVAARAGTSTSNFATVTAKVEPEGVWLYDINGTAAVCIWGADDPEGMVSSEASEDTSIHKPVGSANPVLITQAIRGPEGSVKGQIKRSDLADWNALSASRARTLGMTRVDLAQKVQIFNTWRDHADEFDDGWIPIEFEFVVMR